MIQNPQRLAAIRHNQEIVAPRHSSRRIAALIARIVANGTIAAQEGFPAEAVRQAASV
jgi:hypothetical protein